MSHKKINYEHQSYSYLLLLNNLYEEREGMNLKTLPNEAGQEFAINEFRAHEILQGHRSEPKPSATRSQSAEPFRYYVRSIPLDWARKAASLPGKAAAVGLALWFFAGITKSMKVTLSGVTLRRFGIHRSAGRRGLMNLEAAGLVNVERSGKKSPRVTLIH